ncbi:MAG: AraC family transcriptional regulator [Spirochaetaceae bacterium]
MKIEYQMQKNLTYKNRTVFSKVSLDSFDRVPKLYTDNEACFLFVNSGEISVRSQDDYMNLDKNTALLGKCLNYFFEMNRQLKQKQKGIEVLGIILYPDIVEELFEFDLENYTYTVNFNLKQIEVDKLMINFRESINLLLDNPELADELMIKNKLKEFILLLTKSQRAPSQYDFLSAMFKPNNVHFKTTISHNIYSNLTIDEMSHLCHLSTSSYKRKFKEVFNETPQKYIVNKKIEKAAVLLKNSNLRVSEIAYEIGFDSLSTFNRNFVKTFNISPSNYRLN